MPELTALAGNDDRTGQRAWLVARLYSPFFIPACFAVFVALRLALVFLFPLQMTSDEGWYLGRAAAIAAGQGYSESGLPTAFWPIGYPGFLGLLFIVFGTHQLVGQLANVVFAVASFPLLLFIARRTFRSEIAARVALLLFTFYPNNIAYTPILLTEIFYTFLLLLGVAALIRGGMLMTVCAGLVFGIAVLTKPQTLIVPGMLLLPALLWRPSAAAAVRDIKRLLILYAVICCVVAPWTIRNTLIFGTIIPVSTNGGVTLLTGNNPSAAGGYTETDPLVPKNSVKNQVEVDRQAKALAWQWIRQNPLRFIELIPLKILHCWAWDGEAEYSYQLDYGKYDDYVALFRTVRVVNQVYYGLLLIGSACALFCLPRHVASVEWPAGLFGIMLILYITLITAVFSGQSRFHFPMMPWIIIYASWAVALWLEKSNGKKIYRTAIVEG